jgi:hypothetical protein
MLEAVAYLNRGGASIERNGDKGGGDVRLDPSHQPFAEVVYGSVTDHHNGFYTVRMRPIKKGAYTLSVTLGGQSVARSPYKVNTTNLLIQIRHPFVNALLTLYLVNQG